MVITVREQTGPYPAAARLTRKTLHRRGKEVVVELDHREAGAFGLAEQALELIVVDRDRLSTMT